MHPWIRRALSTTAVAAASLSGLVAFAPVSGAATIDCNALSSPVYKTVNPTVGSQLLTRSSVEYQSSMTNYGYTQDHGVLGYGSATASAGMVPVTRMYNAKTVDFLWATSDTQIEVAKTFGYVEQKVNFYAPTSASSCTVPVHKFSKGDHRRNALEGTASQALIAAGWTDNGAAFYLKSGTTSPTTTTATAPATTTTTTTITTSTARGVPAGTTLTKRSGDITITTPGTVLENVDLDGYVKVQADNVTIRNSILRGGVKATTGKALVMNWNGAKNLVIKDTTLIARNPSAYVDGISGKDLTVQRVDVSGVVDAVKVIGSNVSITDSVFHDAYHLASGVTYQADGSTHNDGVQVEGGGNIAISGNKITGFYTSAIMVTQNAARITGLNINNNTLSQGGCTINMSEKGKGPLGGVSVVSNKFGVNNTGSRACPMLIPATTPAVISGNTWIDSTLTLKPYRP